MTSHGSGWALPQEDTGSKHVIDPADMLETTLYWQRQGLPTIGGWALPRGA